MVKLWEEGINIPEDLVVFNADYVSRIAEASSKTVNLVSSSSGTRATTALVSASGV